MLEPDRYVVELTTGNRVTRFHLGGKDPIEAAMRAFARVADGWPESVEISRSSDDVVTIVIATPEADYTIEVSAASVPG